jgi:tetratricopeptide (TPR) repeat protein
MKNLMLALVLTVPLTPLAAPAAQTPAPDFESVVARLETAALASDVAVVKDARLACLRMLAGSGVSADRVAQLRYAVAYAGWRLAFVPTMAAREKGDLLTDAKTQLDAVIAASPRHAEALGLLSAVYGAQIANNPDLGMSLGPASGEMIGRALALEPQNPRLLVFRGQSQFHTPPEYGGSVRDAEATGRQALQRFEQEPATKPWPNWGRFDAHVLLGQALADRRDNAGARAAYDAALKIAPNSAWVKFALLPAVK